jgi:1-acyl-sn-glycerol-3-phosphate acyltransferase
LTPQAHRKELQLFAKRTLSSLGIELVAHGTAQAGPLMLVANHVSWLDILAINTVHPAYFIAKAEVRRWPVLGWLVAGGGTLFLQRDRKRDAMRMVNQVATALCADHVVAVFPEGTTSDGHGLLPFYANMLQAAVQAQVPVQAIGLRYADANAPVSAAAAYVGDTTLLQSLWAVLRAKKLRVSVTLLNPQSSTDQDRHSLCEKLRGQIAHVLHIN